MEQRWVRKSVKWGQSSHLGEIYHVELPKSWNKGNTEIKFICTYLSLSAIEYLVGWIYLPRMVHGLQGDAVDESSIIDVIDHPEYCDRVLGR